MTVSQGAGALCLPRLNRHTHPCSQESKEHWKCLSPTGLHSSDTAAGSLPTRRRGQYITGLWVLTPGGQSPETKVVWGLHPHFPRARKRNKGPQTECLAPHKHPLIWAKGEQAPHGSVLKALRRAWGDSTWTCCLKRRQQTTPDGGRLTHGTALQGEVP